MKRSRLWSHTVYVCPAFECNARMWPLLHRDAFRCVNGHELSGMQVWGWGL